MLDRDVVEEFRDCQSKAIAFAVYLGHCFGQLLISARSVTCYAC